MQFRPVKQINAVLKQEYFEPTISWALRVVLALNIPLILLPLWKGFSFEVIWAAFGAYMISLIDYKGLHYRKIMIQGIATVLIFCAAILGMNVRETIVAAVIAMFFTGMFAALIRNWSDYGPGIGVATGFFFLFGLSNHVSFEESLHHGFYLLAGAGWAMIITLFTFPFRPADPIKRSVARIWKANTDFLDTIVAEQNSEEKITREEILEKEFAIRTAIDQSVSLFARREKKKDKAHHYDMLIELRRTASLFGAALNAVQEEMELLKDPVFDDVRNSVLYKTLSAFSQASARMAIVTFTLRDEDLVMTKVRTKRCAIAIDLFKKACEGLSLTAKEKNGLEHFMATLEKAQSYLEQSIQQIEEKKGLKQNSYFENYRLSFGNFISGLHPDALFGFIRSMGNITNQQLAYALRVSVALCLGVFLYRYFNIDHGHWIPLTMIIVIQPYYGATIKKGVQRIVGTVAGTVVGGLIMLLPLPQEAFVVLLVIVSFFVAYFLRNNYKIGVFFVTVMMVVLMQISQSATWELIGWRVLSTLIGAGIAVAAGYVFWPVWERERFPVLASEALEKNKKYLHAVLSNYTGDLPAGDNWSKYRRTAEAANNSLFASVQRMYEEPKHVQKDVDTYFAIAGVSIRITREITSIAITTAGDKTAVSKEIMKTVPAYLEPVFDQAKELFNDGSDKRPETAPARKFLDQPQFLANSDARFIRNELEKIVFELDALAQLDAKTS
ncbi:MAG TPA: FUSC family protein [Bacteroidia bacterium]